MNKKLIALIIIGAASSSALTIYWYKSANTAESKVVRKLQYVTPKPAQPNPLKSQQAAKCPEHRLKRLRLQYNGNDIWKKTHEELFQLEQTLTVDEKRLKGTNKVIPLISLIDKDKNIEFVDVTVCDGNTKTIPMEQIDQAESPYYLGLNKRGWLKVMKKDKSRYATHSKAVVEINLRSQ